MGELVATRLAYGNALQKLAAANDRVIALDGDTKNSTFSDKVLKVRMWLRNLIMMANWHVGNVNALKFTVNLIEYS